jgi:phosphotriesterase-related protein
MAVQAMTTAGPLPVTSLGVTLFHEHLVVGRYQMPPEWRSRDRALALDRAIRLLQQAREIGVETVVDPSPVDLGRDAALIAEAARASGMTVICATGLYTEQSGFPETFRKMSVDELTAHFVRELREGIDGTGIMPGIIKCASSDGRITAAEDRALRAAARASRQCGVPIVTHTSGGTMGPEQSEIFLAEGLDPGAAVIGHSDSSVDLAYHRAILSKGARLGIDRIGNDSSVDDDQRLDMIAQLLEEGFASQLMLSHDRSAWMVRRSGDGSGLPMTPEQREKYRSGFTYLFTQFLPRLRDRGFSADQLDAILRQNPQRLFETAAAQRT